MHHEIGGWHWAFIDVALVLVLGGGLAYAAVMWRKWKREPTRTEERDRKTRELFGGR